MRIQWRDLARTLASSIRNIKRDFTSAATNQRGVVMLGVSMHEIFY